MGKRRRLQWVGGAESIDTATDANTAVGDLILMITALDRTADQGQPSKCLIEAIYLKMSTRRLLTTTMAALTYMVWLANVSEGSDLPIQALNSQSLDARAYGNSDILMHGALDVPPLLGTSDLLAFTVNDEIKATDAEFQATRKFDRSRQILTLVVNSDVDAMCRVFCQWRVLLSYDS